LTPKGLFVSALAFLSSDRSLSVESPEAAICPNPPLFETAAAISPKVIKRIGP